LAVAIAELPNTGALNGTLYNYNYQTITANRTVINASQYYDINSTGIVPFIPGGDIRRTIQAVVKTGQVDPSKFEYGLAAANYLCFGGAGSCNRDPEDFLNPAYNCSGHNCWIENYTTMNFPGLFGCAQSDVEAIAAHYNETTFTGNVSEVSWVDVGSNNTLMVDSDLNGTGILIINGSVHFGGTYLFRGIVYVLGKLTARGNFDAWGSVIAASTANVTNTSINGNPTFHWNQTDIGQALQWLSGLNSTIVSWREVP
jgi:hypothetical protein